jgi:hypothetical protein
MGAFLTVAIMLTIGVMVAPALLARFLVTFMAVAGTMGGALYLGLCLMFGF